MFSSLVVDHIYSDAILKTNNYINAAFMALSITTFNHLSEQLNILAISSFAQNNLPNSLGTVMDQLHKYPLYSPLPFTTPF